MQLAYHNLDQVMTQGPELLALLGAERRLTAEFILVPAETVLLIDILYWAGSTCIKGLITAT